MVFIVFGIELPLCIMFMFMTLTVNLTHTPCFHFQHVFRLSLNTALFSFLPMCRIWRMLLSRHDWCWQSAAVSSSSQSLIYTNNCSEIILLPCRCQNVLSALYTFYFKPSLTVVPLVWCNVLDFLDRIGARVKVHWSGENHRGGVDWRTAGSD